ncbi:MBL fold hydrolase [Sulfodiicoccus acidiphilus]|uniref:MBL fold hydrolase n=1 Tax=Sulfodiicoccus acidiphilus TaxID=1670455 RepID=A0A348B6B0_9CREN|nr:MBL fold hydrolase [Sulfodiicoccus acidiphilus]GGT97809.1 MBL fold hydrolase [Sulfodiicoccus acidiphilus]
MVDPGGDPEDILRFLDEAEVRLKLILSTHGHFDHVMSASVVRESTGAKYVVHENDVPLVKELSTWTERFLGERIPSPEVDATVRDGEVIELGNEVVEVLWTPGHTMGSISVVGLDFILTGDTLFKGTVGRTDFGGSPQLLSTTLERLKRLPDLIVYPGHGSSTTLAAERMENPFLNGLLSL